MARHPLILLREPYERKSRIPMPNPAQMFEMTSKVGERLRKVESGDLLADDPEVA